MLAVSCAVVVVAFVVGSSGYSYVYLVLCLALMVGIVQRRQEKVRGVARPGKYSLLLLIVNDIRYVWVYIIY